jgi:hypothetical protein
VVDSRDGVKNNDFIHGGIGGGDTCHSDPDPSHEC